MSSQKSAGNSTSELKCPSPSCPASRRRKPAPSARTSPEGTGNGSRTGESPSPSLGSSATTEVPTATSSSTSSKPNSSATFTPSTSTAAPWPASPKDSTQKDTRQLPGTRTGQSARCAASSPTRNTKATRCSRSPTSPTSSPKSRLKRRRSTPLRHRQPRTDHHPSRMALRPSRTRCTLHRPTFFFPPTHLLRQNSLRAVRSLVRLQDLVRRIEVREANLAMQREVCRRHPMRHTARQ